MQEYPWKLSFCRDDVFSSRTSLDTMFQPLNTDSTDSADVLLVGFEDGTIHLSIYDFFEIGNFNLRQAPRGLSHCQPLLHCSHPFSTTHSLLVANKEEGQEDLYIVPLDLRLISSTGRYLSLLASKSTQMHNVLRYTLHVQGQMYSDFKASQELPTRFMESIGDTLRDQSDCNWIQAAYHLVVTGHCLPGVKEWLVEQVGERVWLTKSEIHIATADPGYAGPKTMGESHQYRLRKRSTFGT